MSFNLKAGSHNNTKPCIAYVYPIYEYNVCMMHTNDVCNARIGSISILTFQAMHSANQMLITMFFSTFYVLKNYVFKVYDYFEELSRRKWTQDL